MDLPEFTKFDPVNLSTDCTFSCAPYTFEFKFGPPKTKAGIRKIPMLDDVYDVLKELYDDQCKYGFSDLVVDGA